MTPRQADRVPWRVRTYAAAAARLGRRSAVLGSILRGVALGVFDREAMTRLDELYYSQAVEPVGGDLLGYTSERYITSGLFGWEREALERHLRPGGRVVVVAAGSGRELIALLELGYDAVGYEPNARLVEAGRDVLARRGHARDRLRASDRDVFPPDAPACDAVIIGWGAFMLVAGQARRERMLVAARAVLPEGGFIILSFWRRSGRSGSAGAVFAIARAIRWARRAEPVEHGDTLSPNYVHLFADAEIERVLARAGFRLAQLTPAPYPHAVGIAEEAAGRSL